jgi:hypothetical protein
VAIRPKVSFDQMAALVTEINSYGIQFTPNYKFSLNDNILILVFMNILHISVSPHPNLFLWIQIFKLACITLSRNLEYKNAQL